MHKALYRIYRPKHFDDIVGQESIIKVLENQIKTSTLSHAYLFTGPRGTGKTSTAKVFAKAVNCIGDDKPCYKCSVCVDSDMDILELDAASNNSVDNIREIRDTVGFSPNVGAYKIYIIDEVHMLSTGAFNALLKTLEEPPAHVIFILATTEPHKIPKTIISRCQRFDFKKISYEAAKNLLIEVLEKEAHCYTQDAVDFIVKKSDGGMRDCLMLLDKSISYGEINMDNIKQALGELSEKELEEFLDIVESGNGEKALSFVEKVDEKGVDLKVFLMDAIEYIRDVMLENLGAIKSANPKTTKLSPEKLASYIEEFCEVYNQLRYAPLPKLFLQASLVRVLNKGTDVVDMGEIKALREELARLRTKVEHLEKNGIIMAEKSSKPKPIVKKGPQPLPIMAEELTKEEETLIEKYNTMMKEVVQLLKQEKQAPIAAFLDKAMVGRVLDDKVVLVYNEEDNFFKTSIENNKLPIVEEMWKKKYGEGINLKTAFKSELPNYKAEEKHDSILELLKNTFPDVEIEIK